MSLKATCSSCTIHQLRGATFRWNVKNFDLHTREAVNNMQWESWMLSGKLPLKPILTLSKLKIQDSYLNFIAMSLLFLLLLLYSLFDNYISPMSIVKASDYKALVSNTLKFLSHWLGDGKEN
jgi:hypothetical protein